MTNVTRNIRRKISGRPGHIEIQVLADSCGVYPGYAIPQYYDSLIAKLVAWGADRAEAIARMRRALADYRIVGPSTTIPFHQLALAHPAFAAGRATVNFIPYYLDDDLKRLHGAAHQAPEGAAGVPGPDLVRTFQVEVNRRRFEVRVAETGAAGNGRAARDSRQVPQRRSSAFHRPSPADGVVSPIQGAMMVVKAAPGQAVEAGQLLFIVEAMKMENEITAPHAGTISEVHVQTGQAVEAGTVLATYQT